MRERSARKTSVFNQKTMFLGYAHSSCITTYQINCNYSAYCSLRSQKREVWFIFRRSRKMNHLFSRRCASNRQMAK
ncbi:MAG: hypothetical protein U5L45_07855 [Saprospiraceae bacterium]|nr:hypothetical protein [Saprospiraceae bacterium]